MLGAVEVGSGITSTEFDHLKRNDSRGLVPVGSLEQHGPHLPVATDLIIAEYVTKHIAKRIGSFVFPPIYYGISGEHSPFFNVSLRYSTFIDTIHDISVSLSETGLKKVIFVNGHHGNTGADLSVTVTDFGRDVGDPEPPAIAKLPSTDASRIPPRPTGQPRRPSPTRHLRPTGIPPLVTGRAAPLRPPVRPVRHNEQDHPNVSGPNE